MGGERREFDEIVVNPEADPPITKDAKHRDFFDAVVNKPDPAAYTKSLRA